jgi:cytochrome c553
MLLELVRLPDDSVHVVRAGSKYWTLCEVVASVRNRWYADDREADNLVSCSSCHGKQVLQGRRFGIGDIRTGANINP